MVSQPFLLGLERVAQGRRSWLLYIQRAFVGAASDSAAPTNVRCIYSSHLLLPLATLSNPSKKGWEALAPPKNCSTKAGGFDLKYFGREVVQGKKMLFQAFI